ncbi:hypothetical protein Tco_0257510 [Tanacetum coccineum]
MDITLTLSPITLLDVQFNTSSPSPPIFGHPIPWNLLEIRIDDDFHDLRSVETEFPAIVVDDTFASQNALPCESQVKNDNEKASIPSFPPPKPTTSYLDDLDFLNDFENEFPAIVYNGAQTSKSDYLTEPTLSPQHIDESDLKDETSLSEYDEVEQNVLYFNDLFPFNIIRPDDLKSDEDNDNNGIDIVKSSGDMTPLPPREQRHPFLRYQGLEYTDADIADFKERLERIYSREIYHVQVVDFQRMPELIRDCFFARMVMEHHDEVGVVVFTSRAWGRLFDTRGPLLGGARRCLSWRQFILALRLHTEEEMESLGFARMMAHSIAGRSQAPEKVTMTDLFYLRGLDIGSGLMVIIPALLVLDMAELVRLQICVEIDDTWAWVALGPERQPDAATGAPEAVGMLLLWRLEEEMQGLRRDVVSLRGLVERSITDQGRFSTWMISCMAQLMEASRQTYQAFNGTFRGSSHAAFQRRTRQRTSEAITSTS